MGVKAGFLSPYIQGTPVSATFVGFLGVPQNLILPHGEEGPSSLPLNSEFATSMLIQLKRFMTLKLEDIRCIASSSLHHLIAQKWPKFEALTAISPSSHRLVSVKAGHRSSFNPGQKD